MKRFLIFMFTLLLVFSLATVSFANDIEQNESSEIKEYIEEKIIPILMGVATSIIALLSTLKGVFSALKGLKESKDTFDKEQAKIKENSKKELAEIKQKYEEIKEAVVCVPLISEEIKELRKQATVLSKEIAGLSEITSLGFSRESELVREGKAREIVRIANKSKELIGNEAI